jgi:hypothetical protein
MRLAHAYLIYTNFLKPARATVQVDGRSAEAWHMALHEPLQIAVQHLRAEGFLVPAYTEPYPLKAFQSLTNPLLLSIQRNRSSRTPLVDQLTLGKSRSQIVEQLVAEDYEAAAQVVREADLLTASDSGQQLAETYATRHKEAQAEALEFFRERDITKALDVAQRLRDDQGFPLGTIYQRPRPAEWLEILANISPTILAPLPSSVLEELRSELAVNSILETSRTQIEEEWTPSQKDCVPYSRQHTMDMLRSATQNQYNLLNFRRVGAQQVGVSGCNIFYGMRNSPNCAACLALHTGRWLIDAAPELPHPGCTHPFGCRCQYSRVVTRSASTTMQ